MEKTEYAKNVMLTEIEYELLKNRYGQADVRQAIEILSDYKMATGREYPSDFLAITRWAMKAVSERRYQVVKEEPETEFELLNTEESAEEFERIMWEKLSREQM